MNKIYLIRDREGNEVAANSKTWCYKTLGEAKAAAKNMVRIRNKRRTKGEKTRYGEAALGTRSLVERRKEAGSNQ